MSWLLVTQDFPPGFVGGIASWASDLARALQRAGQDVTVLARDTGDTGAVDACLEVPIVRMAGRSWGRWQGAWSTLHVLPRLTPGLRVVCATWSLAQSMAPWVQRAGARLSVAFHGSDLTRLKETPRGLRRAVRPGS